MLCAATYTQNGVIVTWYATTPAVVTPTAWSSGGVQAPSACKSAAVNSRKEPRPGKPPRQGTGFYIKESSQLTRIYSQNPRRRIDHDTICVPSPGPVRQVWRRRTLPARLGRRVEHHARRDSRRWSRRCRRAPLGGELFTLSR